MYKVVEVIINNVSYYKYTNILGFDMILNDYDLCKRSAEESEICLKKWTRPFIMRTLINVFDEIENQLYEILYR